MQAAKVIDIKRSFVPVDPNAFPETMHLDTKEDYPENRVPVVPYMGHNFLPTSYGYKSFFGTNSKVGVDSLSPNKPDKIFIFQTLAYKNLLIALCDTGIWAKDSTSAGAWTQLVAMAVPAAGVYYEWTLTVISNKLYVFRANGDHFYKIDTDVAQPLGIAVTVLTPTFITITAQLGMCRIGSRIAFWDAQNAIAWSSADDYTNFTPSVLTGANVTTFNSVLGKISAIRGHGKNALVYASKSVVHLEVQASDTFLLKATPIFVGTGVAYANQSVEGLPDTTHYCYTSTGIYKIENGAPDAIVPEVYDFFKSYTTQPIYLKLLQGRYLAFIILDENLMNGNVQFSKDSYDSASLTFPGYTASDSMYTDDPRNINMCEVMQALNDGAFKDVQAAAAADIPDKKPGTTAEPVWVCHLSNQGIKDLSNLAWQSTPCAVNAFDGTPWLMSPNTPGNKLDAMTTDTSNKITKTGAESWVDGKWTMQRFVQVQTAIWEMEEKTVSQLLDAILGRSFSKDLVTAGVSGCAVSNPAYTYCDQGKYVSKYSKPQFGFNMCSFWLTRFAIETLHVQTKSRTTVACDSSSVASPPDYYYNQADPATHFASPDACFAALTSPTKLSWNFEAGSNISGNGSPSASSNCATVHYSGTSTTTYIYAVYSAKRPHTHLNQTALGTTSGPPTVEEVYDSGYSTQTQHSDASNEGASEQGVLGVETAYCEIVGWNYTKTDGSQGFANSSVCTLTDSSWPNTPKGLGYRGANSADTAQPDLINASGDVCNVSFTSPISPSVSWPSQTVIYPGGSFLLQAGSLAPLYPDMFGAFVYDLHLKKWGKYKDTFKGLLDYSPLNSESNSPVTTVNFGILAGAWKSDGYVYLFDDKPADSFLTWGKIGFYRAGMTDIQEVTFYFRNEATGSISVDVSLDGKNVSNPSTFNESHASVREKTVYPPYSGRWFNISVAGQYDITDIMIKGMAKGRR